MTAKLTFKIYLQRCGFEHYSEEKCKWREKLTVRTLNGGPIAVCLCSNELYCFVVARILH
jgi:hypothetical protein